jgi:hypothetical protein
MSDGAPGAPELTVFSIGFTSVADCRMVVRDLQRQTVRDRLEIIVVAPSEEGLEPADLEGFAAARIVVVPRVDSAGAAMATAVRAARAPLVTYAEEHSYFDVHWAERVIAAHELGYDAVGFAIENANPETLTSWAQLYGEFGPVVAPAASGEVAALSGHHVSYRTATLLAYGDLLEDVLENEAMLHIDLRARGHRLYLAGDAISHHVNISSPMAYFRMDFLGQRGFGACRARIAGWSWARRLLYACAMPLAPLVRGRRIVADIRRSGRTELLPRILAPISLALVAGAVGEMLGYLVGPGDAAQRRASPELERERYLGTTDNWTKESVARARERPDRSPDHAGG